MPNLSDRYYTGREVQRKLGITEPALRNLVNQRKIRKIIPPGKQYGVYLKEEIDTYAEKWLAFLTAQEPPRTVFGLATLQDMQAEQLLAAKAIGTPGAMTTQVRESWFVKNPECDYHLKHNNKLVAFCRFLPVKHDILLAFMEGKLRGGEITSDDVEVFVSGQAYEMLVVGIASEPDVGEDTRAHYVQHLLRGVKRALGELGRRGIIIQTFFATSDTPTGIALSLHSGMEEYGQRIGKRLRFKLDVEKSSLFLLDDYKVGLANWKQRERLLRE